MRSALTLVQTPSQSFIFSVTKTPQHLSLNYTHLLTNVLLLIVLIDFSFSYELFIVYLLFNIIQIYIYIGQTHV